MGLQDEKVEIAAISKKVGPTASGRREALSRLLVLIRSEHTSVKLEGARLLGYFFADFPDLQEKVVDAVYDLCEDPDPDVRVQGYKAIVEISKRGKSWTRRNTDVLIQLLQIDDPPELNIIKKSLVEHINIDPKAALTVLCDYCGHADTESAELDTSTLREALVSFLTQEAKEVIKVQIGKDDEVARIFRKGVIEIIPVTSLDEAEILVKDIILSGPSASKISPNDTSSLSSALTSKASSLSLSSVESVHSSLGFLSLATELSAPLPSPPNPTPALQAYCNIITSSPLTQSKANRQTELDVLERAAQCLELCEKYDRIDKEEVWTLVGKASSAWINVIDRVSKEGADDRVWRAAVPFLRLKSNHRNQDTRGIRDPIQKLRDIQNRAERQRASEGARSVASLIKSILDTPLPPMSKHSSPAPSSSTLKRKIEEEPRPITINRNSTIGQRNSYPAPPRSSNDNNNQPRPPIRPRPESLNNSAGQAPESKRQRRDDDSADQASGAPSLLQRLSLNGHRDPPPPTLPRRPSINTPAPPMERTVTFPPQRSQPQPPPPPPQPSRNVSFPPQRQPPPAPPSRPVEKAKPTGGLQIKGAASALKQAISQPPPLSHLTAEERRQNSLLNRMGRGGDMDVDERDPEDRQRSGRGAGHRGKFGRGFGSGGPR